MSIQGSVNQLLGVAGIFGTLYKNISDKQKNIQHNLPKTIEKRQNSAETPKSNSEIKKVVLNPYIKAEQALQKEGSYKVIQRQMQAQRRQERGEIE